MSLRGRLVMGDIPQLRWLQGWVQPWLWPLVTVARLHRLRSVHLRPTSIAPEILCTRKKPAVCHAQSKSKTSVFFPKKTHTSKGSMMGACNRAVAFPMCRLEWFPWWFWLHWWLTAQRLRQMYSNWSFRRIWIEVPFDLPKKSTSWRRIWVSRRHGSAIQFCVVFGKLCFFDLRSW